jgi:nucleoside-diphosphate-sugar epimerase
MSAGRAAVTGATGRVGSEVVRGLRAAIFGGGFVVGPGLIEAARRIAVPVQFLLPWDDEHVDRADALALFDAFGSAVKTLHANPGDHRTIRWHDLDHGFLARHLS